MRGQGDRLSCPKGQLNLSPPVSRRLILASGLALAACGREPALGQPITEPPLKSLANFPMGTCVRAPELSDPAYADLAARHFSQLTAEWEMKMEYVVQPDGTLKLTYQDTGPDFLTD